LTPYGGQRLNSLALLLNYFLEETSPSARCPTFVVGCDAKSDIRVFSGSTYHLAAQGVEDGLLTGMVNLYPRGIHAWGVYVRAGWWKLKGGLNGRGGFKFTNSFLDAAWRRNLPVLEGSKIINNFQLFGPYFLRTYQTFGIEPYLYIDSTLAEYFNDYRLFDTSKIDETVIRQALTVEREGFARCRKIVVMSKRSADYIVGHYGISQEKIRILPPGANIPERLLQALDSQPPRCRRSDKRALVVGFIGLYPERKGLPTIAEAVRLLRHSGYNVRLHIIGKCPIEISQRDGVTLYGVIDKSVHMNRFLEILRKADIGCMLSRAETAGIALLEFLRIGTPVIATDVGGVPDIVELGAGQLVSPETVPSDLAEHLARLLDNPDRLDELRQSAWRRRQNASWRRVIRELKDVLE
jgi:glycosyltransferase involved in cell wall biosynthesis